MNILLSGFYPNYRYGLAISTLRSYLGADPELSRRAAIEAEGFAINAPDAKVAASILRRRPDVLGFSCYVWCVAKILRVSARLRREGFAGVIVLGGPEATHTAARLLNENPALTVIVRGEGEETLRRLAHHYLDRKPAAELRLIPGLSFRADGRVVETPDRPLIADLNSVPSPYLDGSVDLDAPDIQAGLGCYETYRGCIFSCAFCLWGKTTNTRFVDFERVEREMTAIMNSKIERVLVADAVANLDKARFKKMLRLLVEKNANKVIFDFELVAEMLDDETIELLAALPGGFMECGLQSTDPAALKNSMRFSNLARFRKNMETLRKLNGKIEIFIDLIFGLPGDTLETYRKAVDFAFSFRPDRVQTHQLRALPGTHFHKEAATLGLVHNDRPPYFVRRTKTFSPADFREARRLSRLSDLYNILPQFRLAAALAAGAEGSVLSALEALAEPLDAVGPETTVEQLSTAFERFLKAERKRLPPGAADVLKEFNLYYNGLIANTLAADKPPKKRSGFKLQARQLRYDFAEILSSRNLLSPDLDWRALPKKKTMIVFDEAALRETFVAFRRMHIARAASPFGGR